jgi:outer membrane protein TolC
MKRIHEHSLHLAAVSMLTGALGQPAFAGTPWWGTPPDPFRTERVIRKDTPGLNDPTGLDCAVPSGPLTLSAAVNLALCRNPQTRAAWALAHQQAGTLGVSESAWLPTIEATGEVARQTGVHADVNGDITSIAQTTKDASVSLAWTLYDFGNRTGRIQSAYSLLDAAAYTAGRTVQLTVDNVVQAYYGEVADDQLVEAAKTAEDVTKKTLEITRSLAQGGVAALGDVLQAQTAYQQAVLTREQAEAVAVVARGQLAVTLGVTADEGFKLAADPVPTEVHGLSARMADLMAEAARQRPDLKAAQAQVEAAQANIQVARAAGLPTIQIGAQRTYDATTGVQTENYNQIGITVTVPLFTGFNVSYGVRQAQGALKVQQENLEQVGLTVTNDVWSGYHNLDSANQQLKVTADLVKTSDDNLQVALGMYEGGVGSILAVLTAQAAAYQAHVYQTNAQLFWQQQRAALALALGRLSNAEPLSDSSNLP